MVLHRYHHKLHVRWQGLSSRGGSLSERSVIDHRTALMSDMSSPPARRRRSFVVNDDAVAEFGERIIAFAGNLCCVMIINAEKATRELGEDGIKEAIAGGIKTTRDLLHQISRHLPQDETSRRDYVSSFLEGDDTREIDQYTPTSTSERNRLTFDAAGAGGGSNGDQAIEGAISARQMRRIGDHFGALDVGYTEQDLTSALVAVRTIISDVQDVLLEFDEQDLDELAQMTLISLRILIGYARRTHRALVQLWGQEKLEPPVQVTHGPGDNGAGPHVDDRRAELWRDALETGDEREDGPADTSVLPWEPLAPRLLHETQRLAAAGREKPFTSAAVLAVALPFSGVAVFVGTPVLATDAALQWGARTPVGRTVAEGTQNALELGKLGWVAGKLATKQTLKLASRELDRIGGVGGLAAKAGEGALWSVGHPVKATVLGAGLVMEAGKAVCHHALWVCDLLATVRDEVFDSAGDVDVQ